MRVTRKQGDEALDVTYDWKRYWVPRDGGVSFDSDGFLHPPAGESNDFTWWKTDATSFDNVLTKPCLVLLGEPGIGKTFAIRDAETRSRARKKDCDCSFLVRDLGAYNSDVLLVEDVFRSQEFLKWMKEGNELHVFLDSFDECLLRVDAVAALLADQLNRLASVQNLFIRVASRTAEWQTLLEDALRQKWGKDSVEVYELVPLTRDQVFEAAKSHLPNPERFVEEVIASEVVSFAIKPLTLDLLIRIWRKRGGSLPPTQREIYEQGCRELCTDSEKRRTPKLRGQFSAEQRLAVASHIAAATFFCNRSAVWIGSRESVKGEADISLPELAFGSVTVSGSRVQVTDAALRESLGTGLFTSRGRDRLSWAHQTYGEFLAAHYFAQEGLALGQMLDLLTHPNDAQRKLIPQLHETAAWSASTNPELFNRLVKSQPEVLLRSDVATADGETKAAVVDGLLGAFSGQTIHTDWWAMRKRYRKLCHPKLVQQLRRYIRDRKFSADARIEAISIANACDLKGIEPELVKLALDKNEKQKVREWAAGVASRSENDAVKRRLRPLALGKGGIDPIDELRGAGLKACWPDHISGQELFQVLPKPNGRMNGLYQNFLSHDLVEKLSSADIPDALRWAEQQPEHHGSLFGYKGLVVHIVEKAAEHIEEPNVLTALARTLMIRLRKHDFSHWSGDSSLTRLLGSRRDLRLRLVESIVPLFEDGKLDSLLITRWGLRFVTLDDFHWVMERLGATNQRAIRVAYAHLLSGIFYPDDACRVNAVIETAQVYPILYDVMPHWLMPMQLDSDVTKKARDNFYYEERLRKKVEQQRKPKLLSPAPAERLVSLLDQLDEGDVDAWWKLQVWLEVEDNGYYSEKCYHIDIRSLVGWKNASDVTRARMIAASHRYVCSHGSNHEKWLSRKNIRHYPAVAGVRGLLLLANEARSQFEALPKDVWQRWMPAILRPSHYDELDAYCTLTAQAFNHALPEAVEWTIKVMDLERKEGENLWVLSKLPNEWKDELSQAILGWAKQRGLKPQCTDQVFTALLKAKVPGVLAALRPLIPKKVPKQKSRRLVSIFATRLLMLHGETTDWPKIWALLKADPQWGKEMLEGFAYDYRGTPSPVLKILREGDVRALWEWMLGQYPVGEDRDRGDGGEVTTRDAMGDFRDRLISHLADIGTQAGCEQLHQLLESYPQFEWFRRALLRGQEQMRRNTWNPPSPNHIFRLAENRHSRLVQSAAQLQETLIDSFAILQAKLSGEEQMAQFLWDGDRPKSEDAISDWVTAHLKADLNQRGVVLGREVQIHRFDETDIYVSAVRRDERTGLFDTVKVIIETKGCWNPDLKTAMDGQLVKRYLTDSESKHGIYIVAWFPVDSWSKTDYRRKRVPFATRDDLEIYLTRQAKELSTSGLLIQAAVLDLSLRRPKASKKRRNAKITRARRRQSVRKRDRRRAGN